MSERNKKPGDILKNGYKIISISHHAVLGFDESTKQYATWQFDYQGSTMDGHYFDTNKVDSEELAEARDRAIGDYLLRKYWRAEKIKRSEVNIYQEKTLKEWQEERLKTVYAKQKINKEAKIAHFNNVLNEWIISFIDEFGLDVLKRILAINIAKGERDQRYSSKNRDWAHNYPDLHMDETVFLLQISPEIINEITTSILPEDNYDN